MNTSLRYLIIGLTLVASATSSEAKPDKLTPERVFELTAPNPLIQGKKVLVEISGVGYATLSSANKYEGEMRRCDNFIYPTRFDPPQKGVAPSIITPSFPKDFRDEPIGLKIQLHAEHLGSLIALYGKVERTQFMGFIDCNYGEIGGPIFYKNNGDIVTFNRTNQPMFKKDISSFYLTALPGKSYEVPFFEGKNYRGREAEKHSIKVTLQ